MRQMMISLDAKIFDPHSMVAKRMVALGIDRELVIVIPCQTRKRVQLSPTVAVVGSGGRNKMIQFFCLLRQCGQVLRSQVFDSLTTQDPFFIGLIGVWLKKQFCLLLEVQMHGDFYSSSYYVKSGLDNWVRTRLGKYVLCQADRVRAVSQRVAQSLIGLGLEPEKIVLQPVVIPLVTIEQYQPIFDVHEQFPQAKKIAVVMGRLEPIKNVLWLVDVWQDVVRAEPNFLLLIVGEGSQKKDISRAIIELGLQQSVRIVGFTSDPYSYLKTADVLLFPSLSEGYGMVAMEARAAGCPVIMNDVGVGNFELQPSERCKIIPVARRKQWVETIVEVPVRKKIV